MMNKKAGKGIVFAAALMAGLTFTQNALAAPKNVYTFRSLIIWDYHKTNFDNEGNVRIRPETTAFTTTPVDKEQEEVPYVTIADTSYGSDVVIDVDTSKVGVYSWLRNIYKVELVDGFTSNPNLNTDVAYELKDKQIILKHDSGQLNDNGRKKIKIYSVGKDAVEVEIHIKKESPVLKIINNLGVLTDIDLVFEIRNMVYGATNPVEEVSIKNLSTGEVKVLDKDKDEADYHVVGSILRVENDARIKTPGNYEITVKAEGFKDAKLTFAVEQNDGSVLPPDKGDATEDSSASLAPAKASSQLMLAGGIDTLASASFSGGTGVAVPGDGTESGGTVSGPAMPANIVYDFDLLANATILRSLGMETEESKRVLFYFENASSTDALSIDGRTRLVEWNSFLSAQAEEKTKGNFLTIEEYFNDATSETYENRPYQVKNMLQDGVFGEVESFESSKGLTAPVLATKEGYKADQFTWESLDSKWINNIRTLQIGNTYLSDEMFELTNNSLSVDARYLPVGKNVLTVKSYKYNDVKVPLTVAYETVTSYLEGAEVVDGENTVIANQQLVVAGLSQDFMDNFAGIALNGKSLFTDRQLGSNKGSYHVQSNKVIIKEKELKAGMRYAVTVYAHGYNPQVINFLAKEPTKPVIRILPKVKTTSALLSNQLVIELERAEANWRNAVEKISVKNAGSLYSEIATPDYTIEENRIIITNRSILRKGVNSFRIEAEGYVNLEFNIDVMLTAPTLLAINSDLVTGIVLREIDNENWLSKVNTITLVRNGVEKNLPLTTIQGKNFRYQAADLQEGSYTVKLSASGYAVKEKNVIVKDLNKPYVGVKADAVALTVGQQLQSHTSFSLVSSTSFDEVWITGVQSVKLNDKVIPVSKIEWTQNSIKVLDTAVGTIDKATEYTVTIASYGYKDTSIVVQKPEIVVPVLKEVNLTLPSDIKRTEDLVIRGGDWFGNISKIVINGVEYGRDILGEDISNSRYYIAGSAFEATGVVSISIEATGYKIFTDSFEVLEANDVPLAIKLKEDNVYTVNQPIRIAAPTVITGVDEYYTVYDVKVDGTSLAKESYTQSANTLEIAGNVFTVAKDYNIVVRAKAYKDKSLTVTMAPEVVVPVLLDPPTVELDSTDNRVGEDIQLAIEAFTGYESAISDIYINDERVNATDYSIVNTDITLESKLFDEAGLYNIRIVATGYSDKVVTQRIKKLAPVIVTTLSQETEVTTKGVYKLTFTAEGRDGSMSLPAEVKVNDTEVKPSSGYNYAVDLGFGTHTVSIKVKNNEDTSTEATYTVNVIEDTTVEFVDMTVEKGQKIVVPINNNDFFNSVSSVVFATKNYYASQVMLAESDSTSQRLEIPARDISEVITYRGAGVYKVVLKDSRYNELGSFKVTLKEPLKDVPVSDIAVRNESNLTVGNKVEIEFGWLIGSYKRAITEVYIDDRLLVDAGYGTNGDYKIDSYLELFADNFVNTGDYKITIKANGYKDFTTTVTVNAK